MILTIIISSVIMLSAILISSIVVAQLKLASDINESMVAIYAADSGIEWQLYQIRKGAAVPAPAMANGAVITTTVAGAYPSFNVKSLGSFGAVKRQFEVSF